MMFASMMDKQLLTIVHISTESGNLLLSIAEVRFIQADPLVHIDDAIVAVK
jgi:hypothetical protein